MRIQRRLRGQAEWPFTVRLVSDVEGKRFPSEGAALAYAQMVAGRVGGVVTVYEHGDRIYQAEVLQDGTVVTRAAA